MKLIVWRSKEAPLEGMLTPLEEGAAPSVPFLPPNSPIKITGSSLHRESIGGWSEVRCLPTISSSTWEHEESEK